MSDHRLEGAKVPTTAAGVEQAATPTGEQTTSSKPGGTQQSVATGTSAKVDVFGIDLSPKPSKGATPSDDAEPDATDRGLGAGAGDDANRDSDLRSETLRGASESAYSVTASRQC